MHFLPHIVARLPGCRKDFTLHVQYDELAGVFERVADYWDAV
jgi:hypothetical protein